MKRDFLNGARSPVEVCAKDRRRFYSIALGSLREVQAILELLSHRNLLTASGPRRRMPLPPDAEPRRNLNPNLTLTLTLILIQFARCRYRPDGCPSQSARCSCRCSNCPLINKKGAVGLKHCFKTDCALNFI